MFPETICKKERGRERHRNIIVIPTRWVFIWIKNKFKDWQLPLSHGLLFKQNWLSFRIKNLCKQPHEWFLCDIFYIYNSPQLDSAQINDYNTKFPKYLSIKLNFNKNKNQLCSYLFFDILISSLQVWLIN